MANPVIHWEIHSKNAESTQKFMADRCGWDVNAGNPMGYGLVDTGGGGINGGIVEAQGPQQVVLYVAVDNLQTYLDKAESLGGKTVVPVTEVPGMVTFAVIADAEGNAVGIIKEDSG